MFKSGKKNAVIVGVAAAGACAVCLLPLAVPLLVGTAGIGAVGAGYWVIGGVLALLAALLMRRKMGWLKSSGQDCCAPK